MSTHASPQAGLHGLEPPSEWVRRWSHRVPAGASVLDLACGAGRHVRWFATRGHPVTGVDVSAEALAHVHPHGRAVQADLERGPWPLPGERFGAVVVTHYLWRPLWPHILDAVAPGGVLIYETFAHGQETVGRPSREAFLLRPGELWSVCTPTLRVVAYEDGCLQGPVRFVQRIVAAREPPGPQPARHWLQEPTALGG